MRVRVRVQQLLEGTAGGRDMSAWRGWVLVMWLIYEVCGESAEVVCGGLEVLC